MAMCSSEVDESEPIARYSRRSPPFQHRPRSQSTDELRDLFAGFVDKARSPF
jgi:hypothetical protein